MKKQKLLPIVLFVAIGMLHSAVEASTIIQNQASTAHAFAFGRTFAQSFTATDPRTTIGFGLADENVHLGGLQFTMTLFSGEGVGGTALGSLTRTFTSLPPLDDWTADFFDFDFSNITLSLGQRYTAKISSASGRGEVYSTGFYGNLYSGGSMFVDGVPRSPSEDLIFRVVPVPEPSCLALLTFGFALQFMASRNYRKFSDNRR